MLVLALSMCFVKSKKIANNGDGLNTNIFTTFLLKKCLFIYTYWHFGSAKKPNFQTKKAPYIGICQFKVLLLSGRLTYRQIFKEKNCAEFELRLGCMKSRFTAPPKWR